MYADQLKRGFIEPNFAILKTLFFITVAILHCDFLEDIFLCRLLEKIWQNTMKTSTQNTISFFTKRHWPNNFVVQFALSFPGGDSGLPRTPLFCFLPLEYDEKRSDTWCHREGGRHRSRILSVDSRTMSSKDWNNCCTPTTTYLKFVKY